MKEIYLVYAEAIPARAAINSNIVEVDAIIFVAAESQVNAQILARSALMNYEYDLTKVIAVSMPTPSDISNCDSQLISLYHEAIDRGYGIEIIAHALDSEHPLEMRSLSTPTINETKKY
ncbi:MULTISPECIES: hypothetical protein [Nitrosomonas]|uniref:Uncharacterized protein n=1 Tax=Nitrosomonas communis TaxID=44574 RepID=A0A0F7KJZ2_9PROT|nr:MULTISPECIES: hypothetical protein [Nitrosomonas]AKH39167.1 hypothetical protein AAW31_17225 [Nitrosomonas communis]TYP69928.1 hypothetical protein BCL69_11334 [Nitrosomonas communis]UVS61346.1 hypothetical protein NX761_18035 [Nitrosomonas sp. PLL12]